MRKLFALLLVLTLWFGFTLPASAGEGVAGLTPCSESSAYQQRAANFLNTTNDPQSGEKRAARYAEALCGPEGLPHLIVDGRLSHAGDFLIPSILFLYIAGWIGWVGRSYLIAIKSDKNAEMKEVVIDVPLAIRKMVTGFAWPAAAAAEFASNKLVVPNDEVPISPR
ncbi:Photosystem I reaction center subunit III [Lusitaniella coriacea]|uniref:Photosystem I reaction center subunit III n=1 Tax=Lusitaniella coriacea TaxID=1983105 RepID=UPI003CE99F08